MLVIQAPKLLDDFQTFLNMIWLRKSEKHLEDSQLENMQPSWGQLQHGSYWRGVLFSFTPHISSSISGLKQFRIDRIYIYHTSNAEPGSRCNKISSYINSTNNFKANPSKRITIQSIPWPSIFDASRGVKTLLHPRCQCFHDSKNFRAPSHKMSKKQKLPTISVVFSRNKFTKHVSQNLSRKKYISLNQNHQMSDVHVGHLPSMVGTQAQRPSCLSRSFSICMCSASIPNGGNRWTKWPFDHPNWRSLNPWKGHLKHLKTPKRVTRKNLMLLNMLVYNKGGHPENK